MAKQPAARPGFAEEVGSGLAEGQIVCGERKQSHQEGEAMGWVHSKLDYDHDSYLKEGYSFLGPVLTEDGLAAARENLDRMLADLHPDLKPDEIYSAHQQEEWILKIAASSALLDVIERHIGPNIVLWSTHLICKAPKTGRPIPWHQDKTYWNTSKLAGSVWLALDDVNDENGTMYVLPQWHKFKDLPRRKTADDLFEEEIVPEVLPVDIDQLEAAYYLRAGEAAVHDPLIPHRSTANASNRWRRVLVCRYMRADGEMPEMQYPDYRTGKLFERKYLLVRGDDVGNRGLERV